MTKRLISTFMFTCIAVTACGGTPSPVVQEADLVSVLKTRPSLTKFADELERAGVASTLLSDGSYTIFAPVDRAITGPLDEPTIRHHILPARVPFSEMAGETTSYDTLNNDQIEVDVTEQIAVGTSLMIESDIQASNGIIHVIDRVQQATPGPERLIDGQTFEQAPDPSAETPN